MRILGLGAGYRSNGKKSNVDIEEEQNIFTL
jgi:hypothetical protein